MENYRMFGNSRAFKQYLQDNWRDLYRVAYIWTRDSELASDLVQETIARCLKNRKKFENKKLLRSWSFRVMSSYWHDHFRRKNDAVNFETIMLYSTTNIENEHYQLQLMKQVSQLFEKLKIEFREVLSLVVVEGVSYEEVSKILDISIGTVMSRVSRARAELKGLLKDIKVAKKNTGNIWRIK